MYLIAHLYTRLAAGFGKPQHFVCTVMAKIDTTVARYDTPVKWNGSTS